MLCLIICKYIIVNSFRFGFLISKKFHSLNDLIIDGKIKLLFSREPIEEFITFVKRPKFMSYFEDQDIETLLRLFEKYGKLEDVSVI